ncbi:hypothetical protein M7I_7347 [Glarea lozoyensis 74030]|uniref:Uncharacterized protein n=1 Tax=Glarea lozoyensis (strain ATCC 74030 / MF5533) TaxID=1104152 RepID=H0EX22_GLAL7|nr:hypothetical protein M7I_7347 [Glarea lozoyensis 74030]
MEGLTRITVKISQASQREAIAMRIITVVTLLYLPATFVSTFFSTDIIKYQNPGGGDESTSDLNSQYMGSFSQVAMDRWLQVTVPLTILTILGAGKLPAENGFMGLVEGPRGELYNCHLA